MCKLILAFKEKYKLLEVEKNWNITMKMVFRSKTKSSKIEIVSKSISACSLFKCSSPFTQRRIGILLYC